MAAAGRPVNVPPIEVIIRLNALLIEHFGGEIVGPDNFLNRGSLEWALEVIQSEVFGHDPYPSIAHKAAVLAWTIITGHVFFDGNKRSGVAAAYLFIRANGHDVQVSDDETV